MTTRPLLGRTAAVTAALPLAVGLLVAAAPAAGAAVTAPGDGTVFTSYSSFRISASYDASRTSHQLALSSPDGQSFTIATAPANLLGGTMSYDMDTSCWTLNCSGKKLAPNGTWTVEQSGGTTGSSTFVTRIRPEAPTSVAAEALNPREVRISWRAGDEPDLTGWSVLEGAEVVVSGIGRDACGDSGCSAVVRYAAEGSGDHTYTVQAFRSVAPGSSGTLDSPLSEPASARLDSPPPGEAPAGETGTGGQAPAGETGTGGGTAGGEAGSGSGGTTSGGDPEGGPGGTESGSTSGSTGGPGGTADPTGTGTGGASAEQQALAQRKAFALGFSTFGPKLGIPKLPPLPQAQPPAPAPELPDGTFGPTLGFEDQVLTERVPVVQGPTAKVRKVVDSALDSERLVRSTAGALVLLLLGAHLRRWLGSATADDH